MTLLDSSIYAIYPFELMQYPRRIKVRTLEPEVLDGNAKEGSAYGYVYFVNPKLAVSDIAAEQVYARYKHEYEKPLSNMFDDDELRYRRTKNRIASSEDDDAVRAAQMPDVAQSGQQSEKMKALRKSAIGYLSERASAVQNSQSSAVSHAPYEVRVSKMKEFRNFYYEDLEKRLEQRERRQYAKYYEKNVEQQKMLQEAKIHELERLEELKVRYQAKQKIQSRYHKLVYQPETVQDIRASHSNARYVKLTRSGSVLTPTQGKSESRSSSYNYAISDRSYRANRRESPRYSFNGVYNVSQRAKTFRSASTLSPRRNAAKEPIERIYPKSKATSIKTADRSRSYYRAVSCRSKTPSPQVITSIRRQTPGSRASPRASSEGNRGLGKREINSVSTRKANQREKSVLVQKTNETNGFQVEYRKRTTDLQRRVQSARRELTKQKEQLIYAKRAENYVYNAKYRQSRDSRSSLSVKRSMSLSKVLNAYVAQTNVKSPSRVQQYAQRSISQKKRSEQPMYEVSPARVPYIAQARPITPKRATSIERHFYHVQLQMLNEVADVYTNAGLISPRPNVKKPLARIEGVDLSPAPVKRANGVSDRARTYNKAPKAYQHTLQYNNSRVQSTGLTAYSPRRLSDFKYAAKTPEKPIVQRGGETLAVAAEKLEAEAKRRAYLIKERLAYYLEDKGAERRKARNLEHEARNMLYSSTHTLHNSRNSHDAMRIGISDGDSRTQRQIKGDYLIRWLDALVNDEKIVAITTISTGRTVYKNVPRLYYEKLRGFENAEVVRHITKLK